MHFGHQIAAAAALVNLHPHWPIGCRRSVRSSRISFSARTRPSLRVRRALMPLANPDFFFGELLVEQRVLLLLGGQAASLRPRNVS